MVHNAPFFTCFERRMANARVACSGSTQRIVVDTADNDEEDDDVVGTARNNIDDVDVDDVCKCRAPNRRQIMDARSIVFLFVVVLDEYL
jgi:hypothetical protein